MPWPDPERQSASTDRASSDKDASTRRGRSPQTCPRGIGSVFRSFALSKAAETAPPRAYGPIDLPQMPATEK
jgi:hypothetical protein